MIATKRSPSWAVRRVVPSISQKTSARVFLRGAGASIYPNLNYRATSTGAGEGVEQSFGVGDGQRTHRPLAHIGGRLAVDETFPGSWVAARQRASRRHRCEHPVGQRYIVDSTPQRVERGGAAFSDEDDLHRLCQQLDIVQQGGEREKVAAYLSGKRLEDRLGTAPIGLFAGQHGEPRQHADQGRVAGGDGGVGGRLGARDQPLC